MNDKKQSEQFFQELVNNITAPILHKRGFQSPEIFHHWHDMIGDIIGNDSAFNTNIVKITFPTQRRNHGTVYIASDPMAAMIIDQQKQHILQRLNSYFGYNAIEHIKIIQTQKI